MLIGLLTQNGGAHFCQRKKKKEKEKNIAILGHERGYRIFAAICFSRTPII